MKLGDVFREQAVHCAALGSPFMERLLNLAADRLNPISEVGARLHAWPGDIGPHGASLPLRWAGGLHALKLMGDAGLNRVYPPYEVGDTDLWEAVATAMVAHNDFLQNWLNNAPQTNEVRRSAAIIPAAAFVAEHTGLQLAVSELGASAGLNLGFDHFALEAAGVRIGPDDPALTLTPEWRGQLPPDHTARVISKAGVDIAPIDPHKPEDTLRLLAYLWPDQSERIERTRTAISVADTPVQKGDAADWLEDNLVLSQGVTQFIFHTVAWQYFPKDVQSRARNAIENLGKQAATEAPVAWFAMEADGETPGAGLRLRLWPGNLDLDLGRADFHGRWIDWRTPGGLA